MAAPVNANSRMRPVMFLAEDAFQLRGSFWEARADGAISLLLVHDRSADRSVWDKYVRFYLSRGWNVLSFDLRGHGESVRQEARTALQPPATPETLWEAGWPLDLKGALDPAGNTAALNLASSAVYPAECEAFQGSALTGIHLWDERQPETVSRRLTQPLGCGPSAGRPTWSARRSNPRRASGPRPGAPG